MGLEGRHGLLLRARRLGPAGPSRRRSRGATGGDRAVVPDPGCDESRCARAVIAQGGLDAVAFDLSAVGSLGARIDGFLDGLEEPFDAEMIIPFLAFAEATGIPVAGTPTGKAACREPWGKHANRPIPVADDLDAICNVIEEHQA